MQGTALHAGAPQSGEDVESVVRDLKPLDVRLGVRWEPRAVLVRRGRYTGEGKLIDPVYRGLWEIILDDKQAGTADWRSWTRICFVTEPTEVATGLRAMAQDGAYAPLGPWVVEFLRQADKHNRDEAQRLSKRLDSMNERNDEAKLADGDDAIEEAASKQYHAGTKAGGGVSEFHPVTVQLAKR